MRVDPRVLAAVACVLALVGCGAFMPARDLDEPPDPGAAALLAPSMEDFARPGTVLRVQSPLFGLGEASYESRGNAGRLWFGPEGSGREVSQYVFRYSSEAEAKQAFRKYPPDELHADDWSSLAPVVLPGVQALAADEQRLITPKLVTSEASNAWYFWARYDEFIVDVMVLGGGPLLPRAQLETVLAAIDRAVSAHK